METMTTIHPAELDAALAFVALCTVAALAVTLFHLGCDYAKNALGGRP